MLVLIFWAVVGPLFQLVSESDMQERLPAIALDAKGGVALWNDTVARGGHFNNAPIANAMQLAEGPYRDAAAASMGDQSLIIWLRNDDLYGQRIGSDGKPIGDPIYIAFTDSRHTQRMAVAASRDRYLVVWDIQSRMLGCIIDANGNILEYNIQMISGDFGRDLERVSLASNGSEFLVVWDASTSEPWVTPCMLACPADDRDVHAMMIDDEGHPRRETETILATTGGDPDVASNGRDYLATWVRLGGGLSAKTISAGFTSASDPVTITANHDYGPHLAWDGAAYDLAWINADSGLATLAGSRVNATGRVIEPIAFGRTFNGFLSRDFDLDARDGRIVFALPADGHLRVQELSGGPLPGSRLRSVRH